MSSKSNSISAKYFAWCRRHGLRITDNRRSVALAVEKNLRARREFSVVDVCKDDGVLCSAATVWRVVDEMRCAEVILPAVQVLKVTIDPA